MFRLLGQFARLKVSLPPLAVQTRMKSVYKQPRPVSVRKLKPYKLKNHTGAVARWILVGNGKFKRRQAKTNHLNRKNSAEKKIRKRLRVKSSSVETRLLKKLIPYHRKRYLK